MASPSPHLPPNSPPSSPPSVKPRRKGTASKSGRKITWADTVQIQYYMSLGVKRVVESRLGVVFIHDVLQVLTVLLALNEKDSVLSLLNDLLEGPPAGQEHRVRTWLKSKILEFSGECQKNLTVPPDLLQLLSVELAEVTIPDAAASVAKEPHAIASVRVPPLPLVPSRSEQQQQQLQQVQTSEKITIGSGNSSSTPDKNESSRASRLPMLRTPTTAGSPRLPGPTSSPDADQTGSSGNGLGPEALITSEHEGSQGSDDDGSPLSASSFIRYASTTKPSSSLMSIDRFRSVIVTDVLLEDLPQPAVEASNAVVLSKPTSPKPQNSYQRRTSNKNHPVSDDDSASRADQELDFIDAPITSTLSNMESEAPQCPEISLPLMVAAVERQSCRPSKDKELTPAESREIYSSENNTTESFLDLMAKEYGDEEYSSNDTLWNSESSVAPRGPYDLNPEAASVARILLANGPSAVAAACFRSSASNARCSNTAIELTTSFQDGPQTQGAKFDARRKYVSEGWGGPSSYVKTGVDSESNACAGDEQGDERVNAVRRTRSESPLRDCFIYTNEPDHQFTKPISPNKCKRLQHDLDPLLDTDLNPFMLPPGDTLRQDNIQQDSKSADFETDSPEPIEIADAFLCADEGLSPRPRDLLERYKAFKDKFMTS